MDAYYQQQQYFGTAAPSSSLQQQQQRRKPGYEAFAGALQQQSSHVNEDHMWDDEHDDEASVHTSNTTKCGGATVVTNDGDDRSCYTYPTVATEEDSLYNWETTTPTIREEKARRAAAAAARHEDSEYDSDDDDCNSEKGLYDEDDDDEDDLPDYDVKAILSHPNGPVRPTSNSTLLAKMDPMKRAHQRSGGDGPSATKHSAFREKALVEVTACRETGVFEYAYKHKRSARYQRRSPVTINARLPQDHDEDVNASPKATPLPAPQVVEDEHMPPPGKKYQRRNSVTKFSIETMKKAVQEIHTASKLQEEQQQARERAQQVAAAAKQQRDEHMPPPGKYQRRNSVTKFSMEDIGRVREELTKSLMSSPPPTVNAAWRTKKPSPVVVNGGCRPCSEAVAIAKARKENPLPNNEGYRMPTSRKTFSTYVSRSSYPTYHEDPAMLAMAPPPNRRPLSMMSRSQMIEQALKMNAVAASSGRGVGLSNHQFQAMDEEDSDSDDSDSDDDATMIAAPNSSRARRMGLHQNKQDSHPVLGRGQGAALQSLMNRRTAPPMQQQQQPAYLTPSSFAAPTYSADAAARQSAIIEQALAVTRDIVLPTTGTHQPSFRGGVTTKGHHAVCQAAMALSAGGAASSSDDDDVRSMDSSSSYNSETKSTSSSRTFGSAYSSGSKQSFSGLSASGGGAKKGIKNMFSKATGSIRNLGSTQSHAALSHLRSSAEADMNGATKLFDRQQRQLQLQAAMAANSKAALMDQFGANLRYQQQMQQQQQQTPEMMLAELQARRNLAVLQQQQQQQQSAPSSDLSEMQQFMDSFAQRNSYMR